jgi:arylsulfatase/arylsulfatase A
MSHVSGTKCFRLSSLGLAMLLAAALHAGVPRSCPAETRPNIVLIMTDDMGYGDLGFHGNPVIDTPNLDAMAKRSARLTTFYVSPVCAPTRASLMTGRFNYRTRCIDTYIGRAMMDTEEVTIAEILRDAGYATGIFGKWHLGDCYPMRPMDQGFQQSLVHRGGGIGQPSDPVGAEGKYTDPVLFRNGEAEQTTGYCTDVYYQNAISFINQCDEADRPFFVYLPDNCPHGPFHDVPQDLYEKYKKRNLNNDQFPQDQGHKLPPKANVDQRARIFAMIENVDRNIGRLFSHLDDRELTKNTIVIFMVDNGPNGRRYVAGFQGMKSHVHEGGIRSPFFVHWPGKLRAGHEDATPAAHIDVLPTLLAASGVSKPKGLKLDGRSMLPQLLGSSEPTEERLLVIQSHRGDKPVRYHNFMARRGNWKLVNNSGFGRESLPGEPTFELFDLGSDPLEQNNLAASNPKALAQLRAEYDAWFDDVGSTRPDNYAPPRIIVGTKHEPLTTLTRQDWRHKTGRPWQRDSQGFWLLNAPSKKTFDVRCRFAGGPAATVVLTAAGKSKEVTIRADSTACEFNDVELPAGDFRLEVSIREAKKTRGVHQVDLLLK